MTDLEIVQRMYAAFGNRDRDTILELFDPRIECRASAYQTPGILGIWRDYAHERIVGTAAEPANGPEK